MLLYRLCKEEEIKRILETEKITAIGKYCHNTHKLNTHIYKKDKKYLHFFPEEYQITYLNPQKDKYICTYDIPGDIINEYQGFGYYRSIFDLESLNKIKEYAIPTELITFQSLIKIERITKDLDFEDYLGDISQSKELIYITSNQKTKKLINKNTSY